MDQKIVEGFQKYNNVSSGPFTYGTAGFRMLAAKLPPVMFAVGILAHLRSCKKGGQTVGVMITASHNVPVDNGVKIVEPLGDMMIASWETYATQLANAHSEEELVKCIESIVKAEQINLDIKAKVAIARDSRESGPELLAILCEAFKCYHTQVLDYGLLTTPQLHYVTRCCNDLAFGEPAEAGYYKKIAQSFSSIVSSPISITVDAANGVGAAKLLELSQYLPHVDFTLINDRWQSPDLLNVNCGADFVKTNQRLPEGITKEPLPNELFASFDGDADRVVFYYVDSSFRFHLLDGDKTSTLLASFISHHLSQLQSSCTLGIVQTAYANGSSTEFIASKLGLPVKVTPTGVKHLHHEATKFDIGVYFEANGHGTVVFSEKCISFLSEFSPTTEEQAASLTILKSLYSLINQTVGDAISDLLAVLLALFVADKTPQQWDSDYADLPNKLLKVIVKDRSVFTTTDAERKLVSPAGLQSEIDKLVSQYVKGRSFVRASGTEDAVRVYAEAETASDVDELAERVASLVKEFSK